MASNSVTLSPIFQWRTPYTALFLQDDWRLSNRLTLNAGLRWDYEAPTTENGNQVNAGFDATATALVCAACPASGLPAELRGGLTFADGAFYTRDLNNFGPRVGFTYQATQKLVTRGGYGLTYPGLLDGSRHVRPASRGPRPYVASLDSNRTPAGRLEQPVSRTASCSRPDPGSGRRRRSAPTSTITSATARFRSSRQWSIGVQHQLPWRSVLDVGTSAARRARSA